MLLNPEGFMYAIALDLNVGLCNVMFNQKLHKICTSILLFGKYSHLQVPLKISGSQDPFQERMSDLIQHLIYLQVYVDDILVLTKAKLTDHMNRLEPVLKCQNGAYLKVNVTKSTVNTTIEYLG